MYSWCNAFVRYGQTVVNVAFLLEANDYNVVDANAVFTAQAEEQGVLGLYTLTPDSFSVYRKLHAEII